MIVVTDNGALAHLILIGREDLLPRLYNRVLIPPAVMREYEHTETPEEVRKWIKILPNWAEIVAPAGDPDLDRPGAGEREAIRLALEHGALLLCDDKRAVIRGRQEGLLVTGTLGVLVQAHGNGWIEIEQEIALMRNRTSMYLPKESGLEAIIVMARKLRDIHNEG